MKKKERESKKQYNVKVSAVVKWLLSVAACSGFESLHDDIMTFAESLPAGLVDDAIFNVQFVHAPQLSPTAKTSVSIPNYVSALNSGGCAFLVQATVHGASVYFCNEDSNACITRT